MLMVRVPSLRWTKASIRNYMERHDLHSLYESIITSLIVVQPDDPEQFLLYCLRRVPKSNIIEIPDNVYVSSDLRSRGRAIASSIFDVFEADDVPSHQMIVIAIAFMNMMITRRLFSFALCNMKSSTEAYSVYMAVLETIPSSLFGKWRELTRQKKELRSYSCNRGMELKLRRARKLLSKHFRLWQAFTQQRQQLRQSFLNKLSKYTSHLLLMKMFGRWRCTTLSEKQSRTLFVSRVDIHDDEMEYSEDYSHSDQSVSDDESLEHVTKRRRKGKRRLKSSFRRKSAGYDSDVESTKSQSRSKSKQTGSWKWSFSRRGDRRNSSWPRKSINVDSDAELSDEQHTRKSRQRKSCKSHVSRTGGFTSARWLTADVSKSHLGLKSGQQSSESEEDVSVTELGRQSRFTRKKSCRKYPSDDEMEDLTGSDTAVFRSRKSHARNSRSLSYSLIMPQHKIHAPQPLSSLKSRKYVDPVGILPRTVIHKVFEKLNLKDRARCAMVSKGWKTAIESSLVMNKVDLSSMWETLTDSRLQDALRTARPYMTKLNLRTCQLLTVEGFKVIATCRCLQDLNLAECYQLQNCALKMIVERCPGLISLNISHSSVTNCGMRAIGRNCLNLQYLDISYCEHIGDRGLAYLTIYPLARKLLYLNISGCSSITWMGLTKVAVRCINLQTIVLNDLPYLTDKAIMILTKHCEKLICIEAQHAPQLSDSAFLGVHKCRLLRTLKLQGNLGLTDQCLTKVRKCRELAHLSLSNCALITDAGLGAISALKHLMCLNLANCYSITDKGVTYIAESKYADNLRELNLSNCCAVTDYGVNSLLNGTPGLSHLCLAGCTGIAHSGIVKVGKFPHLYSLDVTGCCVTEQNLHCLVYGNTVHDLCVSECDEIIDRAVEKLSVTAGARPLTRLDLSFCYMMSNTSAIYLSRCCKLLQTLNLAGCIKLDDNGVQLIFGSCFHLLNLNLSATKITDRILRNMTKYLRKLRVFIILYCRNVSRTLVQQLRRHISYVEYSNYDIPMLKPCHAKLVDEIGRDEQWAVAVY